MQRVALYIRVSSDQQAKFGDSLREQEDTLNEYVKSQNNMIIHSTYIDDGISGQKLDRDEFTRLMKDIKNRQIDLILFTKLDRWFRSLKHYLNIQDILEQNNVHWIAVSQPYYDTTTAYGRTFINQVMSFAELEAQMTSERLKSVFANKVKMGEAITGSTPFGYSIQDKRLVLNDEAPIAKDIFEHYNATSNLTETSKYLLQTYGISRSAQGLRRMMKSEKYIGRYRGNHKYCEPLISDELFESVNRQLDMNIKEDTRRHDYIFSGLIKCGNCGRRMNSGMKRYYSAKRKDGTKKAYPAVPVYTCRYAYYAKTCTNKKLIKEHLLEKYLLENISDLSKNYLTKIEISNTKIKDNSKQIEFLTKKLDRLKEAYLNSVITLEEFKTDKTDITNQLNNLSQPLQEDHTQSIDAIKDFLNLNIADYYYNMTVIEKRQLWRSIIKSITFDDKRNIQIEFL